MLPPTPGVLSEKPLKEKASILKGGSVLFLFLTPNDQTPPAFFLSTLPARAGLCCSPRSPMFQSMVPHKDRPFLSSEAKGPRAHLPSSPSLTSPGLLNLGALGDKRGQ